MKGNRTFKKFYKVV